MIALVVAALLTAAPAGDLVDVAALAPHIKLSIRYATRDNFTHTAVYPVARCLLRREVALRVRDVQASLEKRGLGLLLWDCYRPLSVQRRLFALVPDERYVADPIKGSRHNRGAAVDATLVDKRGRELDLGTGFDDFSPRAHRDATDLTAPQRRNRELLDTAMSGGGFTGLPTEWWHYDAAGWERFPVEDSPLH